MAEGTRARPRARVPQGERLSSTRVRSGWILQSAVVAAAVSLVIVTGGWTLAVAQRAADQDAFADDFKTSVWNPGRAILEGRSPMREYSVEGHNGGTVYPPAATLATLPFSLPPYRAAAVLWLLALAAAVLGSLWLCGVRDWRCYLAACASPPVVAGLMYANVSILLVLALALVWRWRDRPWLLGPLLGLVIAGKLFLWPLVFWLAVTRRRFAFALSIAFAGLLSLVGWAAVGFGGLVDYPALMERHAAENDQAGVSVAALAAQLGVTANQVVALAAGIAALVIAASRRRDDLASFAWAVTAAVLASPMVWTHYYALLLVPLALATPAWGAIWFLPFVTFPQIFDAAVGVMFAIAVASWATARGLGDRRRARDDTDPDDALVVGRVVESSAGSVVVPDSP